MNIAFRIIVSELRETCAGLHEDVHYGKVRLERTCIETLQVHSAEHRPCHEEVRR